MSTPPYILEDRTGQLAASDFDDIYDRVFLRVAQAPQPAEKAVTMIYNMGRRAASRKGDTRHFHRTPLVVLEFGRGGALGTVMFTQGSEVHAVPMNKYLSRVNIFRGSLSRKFQASDGKEYKWLHQTVEGQEWTCVAEDGHVVAHYDLKPPSAPVYHSSGNSFTVHEHYAHLIVEFLASLTVMRHIAKNNL